MSPPHPLLAEVAPERLEVKKGRVGPTYRALYVKDGPPTIEGVDTLYGLFKTSAKKFSTFPCLGSRPMLGGKAQPYQFLTYNEVAKQVASIAAAYRNVGLQPLDRVGLFGANCPEWMMAFQAAGKVNMTTVPLYDTLGDNAIEYICSHAEVKMVMVAESKIGVLTKALLEIKSNLQTVVYWGKPNEATLQGLRETSSVRVMSLDEFAALGEGQEDDEVAPNPEDLAVIMYTSGTTGTPKGVMLSHRAILSTVASLFRFLDEIRIHVDTDDSFLSYLPLAHIFGMVAEEVMLLRGASIGYFQGHVAKLMDDLEALKPTIFIGVPRVFDRVYSGVMDKVSQSPWWSSMIFNFLYQWKLHWIRRGYLPGQASPLADRLVFNKLKEKIGGRVRIVVSGAAPLARYVEDFMQVAMCCRVVQGYGLTETCAASFIAQGTPTQAGTVGPPMPVSDLRLEAVEEMGADPFGNPPRGEVCIRGPGLFSGYYKQVELTQESMDEDGFFHTGDVGELTPEGALRIVDRKKNIFKLAQGEYIAVENLENAYNKCPAVDQIWVYGNSLESELVAVVVPKKAEVEAWAQQQGIVASDYKGLLNDSRVTSYMVEELKTRGKDAKLKGFEFIKAVYLDDEHFTIENDLMTPKFSLKRAALKKRYEQQLESMYAMLKKRRDEEKARMQAQPAKL